MLEAFFNWPLLAAKGTDAFIYFGMAIVGTAFFLLRLGLSLFHGADSDFDIDSAIDSDVSFSFFSVLSILAFFMGAGWMGLACRFDWDLARLPSSMIATGFGIVMMLLASGLTYLTRKLNKESSYDVRTALGKTGRVYLKLPAKGQGYGQVELSVSGRRKILSAMSNGAEIATYSDVRVVDIRDDETIIVESLNNP